MSDPKGFSKFARETLQRRPTQDRLSDWKEFYVSPSTGSGLFKNQSARCMDCGVPFCHGPQGCPVENLIPEWNDLVHQGRWKEALDALHATNNFPEFTGRLCPAPCESACVLGINADPVAIRMIESQIIDRGFEQGWVQPVVSGHKIEASKRKQKKIAIVGSGPTGLAAAQQLARRGYAVTVFEKSDKIGGLLRYGIPDFKLEKSVLDRRLEQISAEGVEFQTGIVIGNNRAELAVLRSRFDAICLALGSEHPRDLPLPGRGLGGIHFAMEFLTQQNRACAGGSEPEISAKGKNVVIIGGGDTGSDCLGTALRQGAKSVYQFEILARPPDRRDPSTPWPLWPMQLRSSHAHEEGGLRDWSIKTLAFEGVGGRVRKLRARKVEPAKSRISPDSQPDIEIPTELVLLAMGFSGPIRSGLIENLGLGLDTRGAIAVDSDFLTTVPGVFAAGDAKRGASLIVWAIAEGRKMAAAVDRSLS